MKKIIYLFISVLLITIASCSKDDENESTLTASVIGKWQVEKYSNSEDYDQCDYKGWVDLKDGGIYSEYDECDKSTTNGTWVKNGDNLTVISSELQIPFTFKIKSLTQTSMVLTLDIFGQVEEVTYKKI